MKEPSRSRLRRLSDEEIELWLTVTKTIIPRPDAQLPQAAPGTPARKPDSEIPIATPAPQFAPKPPAPPPLPQLAPLERRLRQRLSRGHADIDAAIDLHGFTQAEAHVTLHHFLARAQADGAKLVLVVTGKGEARPGGDFSGGGVLRRAVPLWLKAPEWRGLIVGFEEASRPHGGAGALYVRLRRADKRRH